MLVHLMIVYMSWTDSQCWSDYNWKSWSL